MLPFLNKANISPSIDSHVWGLIRAHPVFKGIADDILKAAVGYFSLIETKPGQVILQEGEEGLDMLHLVLNGTLEVSKNTLGLADRELDVEVDQFVLATLHPGELFGEISFIRGDAKTATIKCMTRALLMTIDRDQFSLLRSSLPQLTCDILASIIGIVGDRVKQTNDKEIHTLRDLLHHSQISSKANLFFSYVICLICIYNLLIQIVINSSFSATQTSVISVLIISAFCGGLVLMIRQTHLPRKLFGLTTRGWKLAVKDSLIWTVLAIPVLVGAKWLLVTLVPMYNHLPVIDFRIDQSYLILTFIIYGLHSPIQEFVVRGVLQGSLQHFFNGKHPKLMAIIISNALFAATHVHLMNGWLGVIVFFPGLFWGWLYTRHDTLIGVSVSHMLIGWTGLFLLNVESLF